MPHYHILLWIKDAPRLNNEPESEVAAFINKYISCRIPNEDREPILHQLVTSYQQHRDNNYCERNIKVGGYKVVKRCRFGFPRPVREEIKFRDPVTSIAQRNKGNFKKRLYDLPRTQEERFINDYNAIILLLWKGNMDLQYVGEKSAAIAAYVCGYVTKRDTTFSELWNEIDNSKPLWQKLYAYAYAKLKNRECGVIEAVDRLRSQPLQFKSRQTLYLNARMRSKRTVCIKPYYKLKLMDENDVDKYEQNWIDDYYPNRPVVLEDVCYYEFRRLYEKTKKPSTDPDMAFLHQASTGVRLRNDPMLISHTIFKKQEQIEEYRYSLLLLFKPFRNEDRELIDEITGDCLPIWISELETNLALKEHHEKLQEQIAEIAAFKDRLNRAEELPASKESVELEPLGAPIIEQTDVLEELRAVMAKDDNDSTLEEDLAKMNSDQLRVYNTVTQNVIDAETNVAADFRMFVSGAGGTGKSFLIHVIKKFIQMQYPNDKSLSVAIIAPTGLAAFNVNGMTAHRLFKLPVEHHQKSLYNSLSEREETELKATLASLRLLIIDEISMVSGLQLIYIDKRMSEIFRSKPNQAFGAKSVLAFGDLMQLSPVRAPCVFETVPAKTIADKGLGIGSANLWDRDFILYDELSINMRQKEDPQYASLLNRLRFGMLNEQDVALLSTKLISLQDIETKERSRLVEIVDYFVDLQKNDPTAICLLPKSAMVTEFNNAFLHRSDQEVIRIPALQQIFGYTDRKHLERLQKQLQKKSKNVTTTAGVEMFLELSIGARIMLRRNIDVESGLVNGAIGTIVLLTKKPRPGNQNFIEDIGVKFDRNKEPTLIERYPASFNMSDSVTVSLKQFPVILAAACTIHKTQGQSLKTVLADVGSNIFQTGMTYVALSRVTRLEGLHLINLDPSRATCNAKAIDEINRLRKLYGIGLSYAEIPSVPIKLNRKKDRTWYHVRVDADPTPGVTPDKKAATKKKSPDKKKDKSPPPETTTKTKKDTGRKPPLRGNVPKRGRAETRDKSPPTTTRGKKDTARKQILTENVTKKGRSSSTTKTAGPSRQTAAAGGRRIRWPQFLNRDQCCYSNSALQLLFSCRNFTELIDEPAIVNEFPEIAAIHDSYKSEEALDGKITLDTTAIRSALDYPRNQQQCAAEFIDKIIEKLQLDMFQIDRTEVCTSQYCNRARVTLSVNFISINPRQNLTLSEHIKKATSLQEGDICPVCHGSTVNTIVNLGEETPQLLVKIHRHTEDDYCHSPITCSGDEIFRINNCRYRINAAVQHFGRSMTSGHYTAFVRSPMDWLCCNDSIVTQAPFPTGLASVYLLLLQRL